MSDNLTNPIFHDETAARAHFEAIRWPDGKADCPHCGAVEQNTLVQGKSHRPGLYQCNACREPFTVTVGSVMESSHIPLHKWALGFHLMASSKKGISAHQLMRNLGLGSYRTAWFMAHRIREAMKPAEADPLGGSGKIVEVDETFIGQKADMPKRRGFAHKHAILSLVERGGIVRSFHVEGTTAAHLMPIIRANIAKETAIMTDEAGQYTHMGKAFASHDFVTHGTGEYVRGDAHTNTAEGFYSIFKRGMNGIYQHCSEKHLHRYVVEFDFRYSNRVKLGVNDTERTRRAIAGAAGRRLTYQQPRSARA